MSEAQEVIETAVTNQPKKRGCWRSCLIVFLILALPVWWFCFHTTPLRVSKETTYVLGPMTSDGKRIDYFLAMEERLYPPEMKTDDNGYRILVRACGAGFMEERWRHNPATGEHREEKFDPEPFRLQVYEKLGLDSNEKPTLKIESPEVVIFQYDKEHPPAEGEQNLFLRYFQGGLTHWTFDNFPMLEDWYNENTAGIDLLGEAVRKPAFFIPYTREHENTPIFDSAGKLDRVQNTREWARAAQARAHYRLGIGDVDGAIDDIVTILHLARHASKHGSLLSGFVGVAIEGMGRAIGIGSNPEFPPTKEQIERLVAELEALPPRWTLNEVLESERLFGLAATQDMYWGNQPGFFRDDPFPYYRLLFPGMTWALDINIALTRLNGTYDALIDGKTLEEILKPSGNPYNPLPLLFVRSRTNRLSDTLVSLTIPAIDAARGAWERVECIENMQRLTLALLLHEMEHGSLPEGDWREAIKREPGTAIKREPGTVSPKETAEFRCPSHPGLAEGETAYAMIGGVSNPAPTPNQILLVEIREPQKLGEGDGRIPFEAAAFIEAGSVGDSRSDRMDAHLVGSHHMGGVNVGLRSGGVRFISATIDPMVWQSLLDGTSPNVP
jgi:hypothetical protein